MRHFTSVPCTTGGGIVTCTQRKTDKQPLTDNLPYTWAACSDRVTAIDRWMCGVTLQTCLERFAYKVFLWLLFELVWSSKCRKTGERTWLRKAPPSLTWKDSPVTCSMVTAKMRCLFLTCMANGVHSFAYLCDLCICHFWI